MQWAPRITGLGLSAFLASFALDSFSGSPGLAETAIAVIMGLAPALVVLAVVIVGWRYPAVAGLLFAVFALIYSLDALEHPGWVVVIAGPLALEALLFLISWRINANARQPDSKAR
jgi:hypothetical protein